MTDDHKRHGPADGLRPVDERFVNFVTAVIMLIGLVIVLAVAFKLLTVMF